MTERSLEISLFGACIVRSSTEGNYELSGSKHKALFALLATAPFGRRTRAFLQDALWGVACYDSGRQSLRRALADIKQILGGDFEQLISANNSDITLNLSKVSFIGRPGAGQFLEGLDIAEEGFEEWLRGMRANPEQVYSLFGNSNQPPVAPPVPTIAVLPLQLVFGDSRYSVLGDWISQEVCRALSKSNLLAVISHLSSRALASDTVEVTAIKTTLNADYCVSGCMRVCGDEIVVDADLLDVHSGRIMWTRQFSRPATDFLARFSDGVDALVRSVGRSIAEDAISYIRGKQISELDDHRLLVAGAGLMHRQTLKAFAKSRSLIDEVAKRAPRAAETHAWRGKWYILSVFNGWSTDPAADTQSAIDCTARALDIDPDNAFCLSIDGFAHNNLLQRLDIARERYDLAIHNNPNEALSWLLKGALHAFQDESEDAVAATEKARRLSPLDPFGYFYDTLSATAYLSDGNYESALEFADRSYAENCRHLSTLRAKITALHNLGREFEARACARELRKRQPDISVDGYLRVHPCADYELGRSVAEALRAAGIP